MVLTTRTGQGVNVERSLDLRHFDVLGPMTRDEAVQVVRELQADGDVATLKYVMPAWPVKHAEDAS